MCAVPKSRRTQASTQYVYNAQLLLHKSLLLAMRLPKRWAFYFTEHLVDHAHLVLHHAKSANSIYVSCALDAQLRRLHLQQAYCHAQTLSTLVDEVCLMAPSRTTESGRVKPCVPDGVIVDLISCLDEQFGLIKGVMRSDARRYREYLGGELAVPGEGLQLSFFDMEGVVS